MGKTGPKRQYTRADVVELMRNGHDDPKEPWTSTEVAEELGCDRQVAYDRLRELHTQGRVSSKKIGARGRVWWVNDTEHDE